MKTLAPPKVRILPAEMEAGSVLLGSPKQAEKIRDIINSHGAMLDAVESRVIWPLTLTPEGTKMRLHFMDTPEFWIACVHSKNGDLNALTLEFDDGQITFTRESDGSISAGPSHFTLSGNGCGDTVAKGRNACLATLLMGDDAIARHARTYLRERTLGKEQVAA